MKIKLLIILIFMMVPKVESAIVYSGLQNLSLSHNSNTRLFVSGFASPDVNLKFDDSRSGISINPRYGIFDDVWILSVDAGFIIHEELGWVKVISGAGLVHYDGSFKGGGFFYDKQDRYLPLRIPVDENVFFGWMRISHNLAEERLTIHDWAWNSAPGEPILAGQIPEPKTTVLLTGLCALLAAAGWRWRRR